jgi:signal transduction histidine kinase
LFGAFVLLMSRSASSAFTQALRVGRQRASELSAALDARDEFLAVASHELRTPLTALNLSARRLEKLASEERLTRAPTSTVAGMLAVILRQSRHLSMLIDQLLDVSRIRVGTLNLNLRDDVDLARVVRATVSRLESELAHARCAITIIAREPFVGRWDWARLDQVVSNLLVNAMKFGAGKPIDITLDGTPTEARLTIVDHGIGISPPFQSLIFERFERQVSARNYGGLGLGLYIARQIVEAHHGTISVASEPNQGATFTVTLPLTPARAVEPARAVSESASADEPREPAPSGHRLPPLGPDTWAKV